MKKILIILMAVIILAVPGCTYFNGSGYKSYSDTFFDTFNTLVQVTAYTESEEEFRLYFEKIH